MMNTINPYHASYVDDQTAAAAPFAGRQDAFARLYARLFDPASTSAILFIGRRHSGKTVLLHNAAAVFKELALGIHVPLRQVTLERESAWLLALAQIITSELVQQGYIVSRLSQLESPGDDMRHWLEVTFLPQILGAVRRKLLILLDDVDCLLLAVRDGQLPEDTFAYLLSLTEKTTPLYFAATISTEFEDDLDDLAPLIAPADVIRLPNLAPDETKWLLQAPVQGLYSVPDECTLAVQRAVGGAPGLVQHFGYQFFKRWEATPELNVFTLEDVKAVTPAVYLYNEADYRDRWERLSANERTVLTAISGRLYDDPLGRIDAAAIQAWLVDTDFPIDITTINATLRSLEYREILQPTPNGITLSADLMQTWLLENARLGVTLSRAPAPIIVRQPVRQIGQPENAPDQPPRRGQPSWITPRLLRTLTIIFILLVIANLLAYAWVNSGSSAAPNPPASAAPTVSLVTPPATIQP